MKKILKGLGTALVMIVLCFIGGLAGFYTSILLFSGALNVGEAVLSLIGIVLLIYLSVIIHEGGHLVCGLISGYGFSSFRIGSFMWVKQEGKIKLRRLSIAGTGGQCLMTPPQAKNGKIPVILYNLGGVIANIVFSGVLTGLAFLLFNVAGAVSDVMFIGAVFSLVLAVTNGLPMNMGGIANDGMNAIHLSKNPDAADSFRKQLLMNAAQTGGARLSDMPDEWFTLPEGADMQNVHNASLAVFSASRALDRLDTVSAEQEIKALLDSGYNVTGLHKNLLKCDLVYARLINSGKEAEISSLLTIEQLKFMKSMKSFPSVIRTEYTVALIRDNDEKKAEKLKADFEKRAKKYPYPTDIQTERELFELALKNYNNLKSES